MGQTLLPPSTTLKRMSMELGGNAPFIVFNDRGALSEEVYLDQAVMGLMQSKFRGSGQTCVCANRVYVHEGIKERFLEKLIERVGSDLKLGNGLDPGVTLGPLISGSARDKVHSLVQDAVTKGARLITGGQIAKTGQLEVKYSLFVFFVYL